MTARNNKNKPIGQSATPELATVAQHARAAVASRAAHLLCEAFPALHRSCLLFGIRSLALMRVRQPRRCCSQRSEASRCPSFVCQHAAKHKTGLCTWPDQSYRSQVYCRQICLLLPPDAARRSAAAPSTSYSTKRLQGSTHYGSMSFLPVSWTRKSVRQRRPAPPAPCPLPAHCWAHSRAALAWYRTCSTPANYDINWQAY